MSEVVFTVRGTHTVARPPERGIVLVAVGLEGPDKQKTWTAAVDAVERLVAAVRGLHDPEAGPVTWWSQSQLRVSAHRPWNQEGKQLPLVHTVATEVQVKFSDLGRLGTFIGEIADWPGIAVNGVEWALTEKVRVELTRSVRTQAVRDARTRAQEYADALGLGEVRPLEIADAGMLGHGLHANGADVAMMARAGKGPGAVELAPEEIEISAAVDARFTVGADLGSRP